MRGKVTVFFSFLFAFAMLATAADKIPAKKVTQPYKLSAKVKRLPVEKITNTNSSVQQVAKTNGVRSTAAADMMHVGTSGNGYGWLMTMQRSLGHYVGTDIYTSENLDYLLVGFRGHGDGNADMAVGEVNVDAGLSNGTLTVWEGADAVNNSIDPWGSGARYPCVVALDHPIIGFNQYVGDVNSPADPAFSHPYMVMDYSTYGPSAGGWSTPDFQMDVGWLNPTLNTLSTTPKENRLWNGPISVVLGNDGVYHWVGVYDTWYTDLENQLYHTKNEKYIMNAHSIDGDMADGWVLGQDEGNDPVWIDTSAVQLARWGVDLNSSGFGVIAGPGALGGTNAINTYEDIRITYATTTDFGLTWSAWDTVSLVGLGIDPMVHLTDSIYVPSPTGTGSILYQGPAFMGNNTDMSVMVDDNNSIYVSFTNLWGAPGESGWYPNYKYTGVLLAKKVQGSDWGAARIMYNNGIWVGDDDLGQSPYFLDNESQLSMDESGNIYCAWLDRRRTGTQISRFAKYSDPDDNNGTVYNDYKTDVYASHSVNGGQDWSEQINLTDTPSSDEYELNLALKSRNQNAATEGDYGRIWFAYVMADTVGHDPATDAMIEMTNEVWVGEGQGFNPPAAIGDDNPSVATNYSLQQNYPNPFNPVTTIKYSMPMRGQVTLTVYNALGQKVSQLVNAVQTAGEHSVTFNAAHLASGIYYYKIVTGNFVQVRKMALLK